MCKHVGCVKRVKKRKRKKKKEKKERKREKEREKKREREKEKEIRIAIESGSFLKELQSHAATSHFSFWPVILVETVHFCSTSQLISLPFSSSPHLIFLPLILCSLNCCQISPIPIAILFSEHFINHFIYIIIRIGNESECVCQMKMLLT